MVQYCRKCGAKLDDDSKFCEECGFSLDDDPTKEKTGRIPVFHFLFVILHPPDLSTDLRQASSCSSSPVPVP